MRVLIRVDASIEIGYGHLVRCVSIAEYFQLFSFNCIFVHKKSKEGNTITVKDIGGNFDYKIISSENEIENYYIIGEKNLILLDVNNVPLFPKKQEYSKYINYLKKSNFIVVSFEEFIQRKINSDILIIPYVGASRLYNDVELSGKLLLGQKYFVFRNEFILSKKVSIKAKVKNIFICMGGSDPNLLTEKYLSYIVKSNENLNLNIVFAQLDNLRIGKIRRSLTSYNGTYVIHVNPINLASIILDCDIGVINSGLIKYETALLGLPCLCVSNNAKHEKIMQKFINQIDFIHLGVTDKISESFFINSLCRLMNDKMMRKKINLNCLKSFDGNGVKRIFKNVRNLINDIK